MRAIPDLTASALQRQANRSRLRSGRRLRSGWRMRGRQELRREAHELESHTCGRRTWSPMATDLTASSLQRQADRSPTLRLLVSSGGGYLVRLMTAATQGSLAFTALLLSGVVGWLHPRDVDLLHLSRASSAMCPRASARSPEDAETRPACGATRFARSLHSSRHGS